MQNNGRIKSQTVKLIFFFPLSYLMENLLFSIMSREPSIETDKFPYRECCHGKVCHIFHKGTHTLSMYLGGIFL